MKGTPICILPLPMSPNFTLFALQPTSRFGVTGPCERSGPNDPKMAYTKWSKILHMHITTTLESKFHSFCFSASQPLSSYRPFWVQVHWGSPKWQYTLKGRRYSVCISQLPRVPNFTQFRSVISYFQDIGIFHFPIGHSVKFNLFFSKTSKFHNLNRQLLWGLHRENSGKKEKKS